MSVHPWGVRTAMNQGASMDAMIRAHHSYLARSCRRCGSLSRDDISDAVFWLASDLSRAVTATQREPPRCDPAGPGQEAVAPEGRRNRRRSRIASRQARAALSSAAPTNATKRSSALV